MMFFYMTIEKQLYLSNYEDVFLTELLKRTVAEMDIYYISTLFILAISYSVIMMFFLQNDWNRINYLQRWILNKLISQLIN